MSLHLNIGAVACGGRVILIEGPPASGKSSLALALIDRGAQLISDDGVALERQGDRLVASPPPRATGLLEVRGVGLVAFPLAAPGAVALVIRLAAEAPRFVENPDSVTYEGVSVPLIRLWPDSPVLALRAETALRQWGMPAL